MLRRLLSLALVLGVLTVTGGPALADPEHEGGGGGGGGGGTPTPSSPALVAMSVTLTPEHPVDGDQVAVTATVTASIGGAPVPGTATLAVSGSAAPAPVPMTANGPGGFTGSFAAVGGATHVAAVGFTPADPGQFASSLKSGTVTALRRQGVVLTPPTAPAASRHVGEEWTPTPSLTGGGSADTVVLGTSTPDVCALTTGTARTIEMLAAGTCTVTADQAAAGEYAAAPQVAVSFPVALRPVTLTVTTDPTTPAHRDQVTVTVTATDQLDETPLSGTVHLTTTDGATPPKATTRDLTESPTEPGVYTATLAALGGRTHALDATFTPTDPDTWTTTGTATATLPVTQAAQDVTIGGTPTPEQRLVGAGWTPTLTGGDSDNDVTLTSATPTTCTVTGRVVTFLAAGTCTLTATQPGDEHHQSGAAIRHLEIRRPVTLTVTTDPTTPVYGAPATVRVTATDPGSGGPVPVDLTTRTTTVAVTDPTGGPVPGTVTQVDGRLELAFEPAAAGLHTVLVQLAETPLHQARTLQTTVVVGRAAQLITHTGTTPAPGLVGESWVPSATGGGSGQAVLVGADSKPACHVLGGTVVFEDAGVCTITLNQVGDANHDAAPTVEITLPVRIPVVLTLATTTGPQVGELLEVRAAARAKGSAIAGHGTIAVTPGITSGATTWFGGGSLFTFRPTRATTYTVTASFEPTQLDRYALAATDRTVRVGPGGQVVTARTAPPSPAYVTATWTPDPVGGGSSATPRVVVDTPGTCSLDAGVVRLDAVGSCRVRLVQGGDDDYRAAPDTVHVLQVLAVPVSIRVTWTGYRAVGESFTLSASATATMPDGRRVTVPGRGVLGVGQAPTAQGSTGPAAWPGGAASLVVVPHQAGTHPVTATFTPADPDVFGSGTADPALTVSVARGTEAIAIGTAPPAEAYVDDTWTPDATGAGSGRAATLSVVPDATTTAPVCSQAGGVVTHLRPGTCTVTASLAGDANRLPAPTLTRRVVVLGHPTDVDVAVAGPALVARDLTVTVTISGLRRGTAPEPVPGTVQLAIDGVPQGEPIQVVGGTTATGIVRLGSAGEHEVTAELTPDDAVRWRPDSDGTTVATARSEQTITVAPGAPTSPYVGETWSPTATSSSGLRVTADLSANSGSGCSLADGLVTFTAAGPCLVEFRQAGDVEYDPATPVTHAVTVTREPTETLVAVTGGASVGEPALVTATSATAGSIAFSLDTGGAAPTPLGDPVPLVDGVARTAVLPEAVGDHAVLADLVPTEHVRYATSRATGRWPVGTASTTVSVTVLVDRVQIDATADRPAAGTPTGTVAVGLGDADAVTVRLVGGRASLPVVLPADTEIVVTASYAGDAARAASTARVVRGLPTLTATLSRAANAAGWHDGPVRVSFTCTTTSAALTAPCPAPVTLGADGPDQSVTRSVVASDGGRAEVAVRDVDIDTTPPRVGLTGIQAGATYLGSAGSARCDAGDTTSGVASCTVGNRQQLGRLDVRETVTATDRAGNTATATVAFVVLPEWVAGATRRDGSWVTKRRSVTLRVLGDAEAPRVLRPRGLTGAPSVAAGLMTPVRIADGRWLWEKRLTLPRGLKPGRGYRFAVQTPGQPRRVLRVVLRRR